MLQNLAILVAGAITTQPLGASEFPVGQLEQRVSEVWRMPAMLSLSDEALSADAVQHDFEVRVSSPPPPHQPPPSAPP